MDRYSEESLRKIYEYIHRGSSEHLLMSEAELRADLKSFPESTLLATAFQLGLKPDGEAKSNPITPKAKPEVKVEDLFKKDEPTTEVASVVNMGAVRELKKYVDAEVTAMRRLATTSQISNGKAHTQAINNRNEVNRLADKVANSLRNQEAILASRLDAIANTVTGYMASGGSHLGKTEPLNINIHLPNGQVATLEGQHTRWDFEKLLRLHNAGININLSGPRGSGKSTVSRQLADAQGLLYYRTDLSGGASESMLTTMVTGVDMRPVASEFLCGYGGIKNVLKEDGLVWPVFDESMVGLCCLEECDAADPNVMVTLNGAIGDVGVSRSSFMVSNRFAAIGLPAKVMRGERNRITACMNTTGMGMDLQYAGRQAQDAAFMDRFYTVYIGYDEILEAKIGMLPIPLNRPMWIAAPEPTLSEWQELARWVIGVREVLAKSHVKIDWGTRMLLKAKAARYAGVSSGEVQMDLLFGLPEDVRMKALALAPKAPIGPGQALGQHLASFSG